MAQQVSNDRCWDIVIALVMAQAEVMPAGSEEYDFAAFALSDFTVEAVGKDVQQPLNTDCSQSRGFV